MSPLVGPKRVPLVEALAQPMPKDAIPGGLIEGVDYHKVQRRIAQARRQAADERHQNGTRQRLEAKGLVHRVTTTEGLDRAVYCSRCGQDTQGRQYPASANSPATRVCFDCASPEARAAVSYPEDEG
jgi:hypothetical protein